MPIVVKFTSPTGEQLVAMDGITTFIPPSGVLAGFWYIDLGARKAIIEV